MQQPSQECAGAHRTGPVHPVRSCTQSLAGMLPPHLKPRAIVLKTQQAAPYTSTTSFRVTEQTRELKLSEVNFTLIFQS